MGRDYPDWGGRLKSQNQYLLYDLAELAARLGSPVTYERNGRVMWYTDFNGGLGEFTNLSNGSGAVTLSTSNVFTGPYAANLAGDATSGDYASMTLSLPLISTGIHGAAFFLCPIVLSGYLYVNFNYWKWGDSYGGARLRFDFANGYIQALDDLLAWQIVYDMGYQAAHVPHYIMVKWVIDFDNKKQLRLYVNDDLVSLEDYLFTYVASGLYMSRLTMEFHADGEGDGAYNINLDRIIYTVDEPGNGP